MVRIILFVLFSLAALSCATAYAGGNDGGFAFPRLAAIRANAQARAFNAQANLNVAKFNAAASAAVFKAPVVQFKAPVVQFNNVHVPRSSAVFFGTPVVAAPTIPFYGYAAPVVAPAPAFVAPAYAPPAVNYSFNFQSQFSSHCMAGF